MKVLVFGSTTDRQMLAVETANPDELDVIFANTKTKPTADKVYSVFFIDDDSMNIGVEKDGKKFYLGVEDGFKAVPKKLKPAKARAKVDPKNRFVMGTFKEDDSEDNDYLISLEDERASLVDHPKYQKCGVGGIDYASAWYVSEEDNQESVVPPVDPPNMTQVASTVLQLSKNKSECVAKLADFHGLTEFERSRFMKANFRSSVDATTIVLYPADQAHIDTASQLLLRTPGAQRDLDSYSAILGCETGHIGMTHDDTTSTAILGQVGERAMSLCVLGNNTQKAIPLIVSGLEQCKHPTVLIDAVGLGLSEKDLKVLSEKTNKQFTVVVKRSKDHNDFAEKAQDCGSNVEVIRSNVGPSCQARFKSSLPFCMVYSGSKSDEKHPFENCDKSVANLLSPLFCTSMLYHQNWVKVDQA